MAEDLLTDDEQWEAIKRWTAENGVGVVACLALGAALVFGYRFYQGHAAARDMNAAAKFNAMTAAFDANDRAGARRTGNEILQSFPSTPYADQAELLLARMSIDEGHAANAESSLSHVMNASKDDQLQHIARLRLARIQIDQGKPDDAIATLALAAPGKFAARYHAVRGDALYAKKDTGGAVREYQAALDGSDPGSPDMSLLELKIADLGASIAMPAQKAKP
jgi:predicted negative regulator of RcsB-dependent stress response